MVSKPVHLLGRVSDAAQRPRDMTGFGRPYALVRLLHSEDRLAVDESDAHPLADRVRVFPPRARDVGQSARRANICIREGDEPPSTHYR